MSNSDPTNRPLALVHFVGFSDDRYWNAVKVFGLPDYVHRTWDGYAADEIAPQDTVVFATGEWSRPPRRFSRRAPPKSPELPRRSLV